MIIGFCVQGLRDSDMNFDKKEGFETNLVLELCKKELCINFFEKKLIFENFLIDVLISCPT